MFSSQMPLSSIYGQVSPEIQEEYDWRTGRTTRRLQQSQYNTSRAAMSSSSATPRPAYRPTSPEILEDYDWRTGEVTHRPQWGEHTDRARMPSSSTTPRGHYGPVSKTILDDFDWRTGETIRQSQQTQRESRGRNATPPAVSSSANGSYRVVPGLLEDFDDKFSSRPYSGSGRGSVSPDIPSIMAEFGEFGVEFSRGSSSRGRRSVSPDIPSIMAEFGEFGIEFSRGPFSSPGRYPPVSPSIWAGYEDEAPAVSRRTPPQSPGFEPYSITPAALPGFFFPEVGFGQRYQAAEGSAPVVLTNQHTTAEVASRTRECIVCTDSKAASEFPPSAVTKACKHAPSTCLECIATSIRSDLNNRLWNEIGCPECRERLQYEDVQKFADPATKERYQTLSFRSAVSEADNFVWCPSGCGHGQVHDGGLDQPIVVCMHCNVRSCFHHKVAWHENLTCEEYDSLQADPLNFRSRFDIENETAEMEAEARRIQEDRDRAFAQSLMAQEEQTVRETAGRERERAREEKERAREERERQARESKERKAREEREWKARQAREAAAKRKAEEDASNKIVKKTTKPCPGCGSPIEKNRGCAHMTCTRCRYEFCWGCNEDWDLDHNIRCGRWA